MLAYIESKIQRIHLFHNIFSLYHFTFIYQTTTTTTPVKHPTKKRQNITITRHLDHTLAQGFLHKIVANPIQNLKASPTRTPSLFLRKRTSSSKRSSQKPFPTPHIVQTQKRRDHNFHPLRGLTQLLPTKVSPYNLKKNGSTTRSFIRHKKTCKQVAGHFQAAPWRSFTNYLSRERR